MDNSIGKMALGTTSLGVGSSGLPYIDSDATLMDTIELQPAGWQNRSLSLRLLASLCPPFSEKAVNKASLQESLPKSSQLGSPQASGKG